MFTTTHTVWRGNEKPMQFCNLRFPFRSNGFDHELDQAQEARRLILVSSWSAFFRRQLFQPPTRYLLARQAAQPPSTGNATPVINAAPGEQR
jgi:hypothetical protein